MQHSTFHDVHAVYSAYDPDY